MSSRLLIRTIFSSSSILLTSFSRKAFLEETNEQTNNLEQQTKSTSNKTIDKKLVEKIDNELYWKDKANNCSFCRQFLESPCNIQFRKWSNCVDQAKSLDIDYISSCKDYTTSLFECGNDYKDWFEAYIDAHSHEVTDSNTTNSATDDGQEEEEEEEDDEDNIEIIGSSTSNTTEEDVLEEAEIKK